MPRNTLLHSVIFGAALLASGALLAQNDEIELDSRYENWYQVELIVFERLSGPGALAAESWPKNLSLQYPLDTQYLFTEDEWQELITPPIEEQTSPAEAESGITNEHTALSPAIFVNPDPSAPVTLPDDINTETNDTPAVPQLPEMEAERITLTRAQRSLNNIANALARRNTYRVLFHEAWRQELIQGEPESIFIDGGEQIGEHKELEGYIELSVNRYLHLKSNIWRTRFELNYGQQTEYWPKLPSQPELPYFQQNAADAEFIAENEQSLAAAIDTNISFDPLSSNTNTSFGLSTNNNATTGDWRATSENTALTEIEKQPYVIKSITTLRQQRRMRSEELHYIDHPELGIIVKLIPYEVALPAMPDTDNTPETQMTGEDSLAAENSGS
jgi:hypothetical protein